ncbi:MAG: PQQ-binding-like beta-propeller repeat protein [Planctomycetaceae bacterium]|nr:PQQ-binding-like beta-propeller repeat protein [Planctomycetaceae bacterium]
MRYARLSACCLGAAWLLAGLILGNAPVLGSDWPMYRGNLERTGSTNESIATPLKPHWIYNAPGAPRLSWSSAEGRVIEGKLIGHRVKYDDAIHPVVVGEHVYFGSSVDHQMHCRNLRTGELIWSYFADGPIRLAPQVTNGHVYFGSDDGYAYCLNAENGTLVWKVRGGPADEWLLARGEMISRWPIRTGVLVDAGVAYFGAGIFPHEDVYVRAVNAENGASLWTQDNISAQDAGRNDLSPQGYLLASQDILYVPSGGTLPAAFDRKTGEFLHKRTFPWRSTAGGVIGGVQALLADGQLYASGPHHLIALDQKTGDIGYGWFAGRQMVVSGEQAYVVTGELVARLNREQYAINSRERQALELQLANDTRGLTGATGAKREELQAKVEKARARLQEIALVGIDWQQPTTDDAALLATGNLLFVGGTDRVSAYSIDKGDLVWQTAVQGAARGLVLANGQLLVSTNRGHIYAFASTESAPSQPQSPEQFVENPYPQDELSNLYDQAADEILKRTDIRKGFALIVGNEQGRLAYELARRTELTIYAVDPDAEKVRQARLLLAQAGLYGTRIIIHHRDSQELPYSNYFANLIASDTLTRTGQLPDHPAQLARHLKPAGGVIVFGRPETATGPALASPSTQDWFARTNLLEQSTANISDGWSTLTRGMLPGAGNWSHQYGNPSNTAVTTDTRIKGGLGVLWFGDPGPGEMVNRHEGAVGPLAVNGRLFVQGENTIMAYDAYNGTFLWKHENTEAQRTGVFNNQNPGNLAASDDGLFHFIKDQCFEHDAATGKIRRIHRLPKEKDQGQHEWGYIAIQNGLLFGTATVRQELESRLKRRGRRTDDATDALFAIDLQTGEHRWIYQGSSISHHTIAIGPDNIFFIDSSITSEQREELLREDKSALAGLTGKEREIAEDRLKKADVRRAVSLAASTGEVQWANPVDVTDCSEIAIGGGKLTLMYHDGVLVLCGANANGHYWNQFIAGDFSRRRLVALSAEDGYKLWAKDANYKDRPIIVGQQVFAEPWSYDLKTGDQKMRVHPLTGEQVPWSIMRTGHHCGMLTGCESGMLLFRSGDTGFYDLESESGTRHFAGHRLGCWINAIPANGLVLIPEASAGCVCLFSISSTIVMEPREPRREWAIHSVVGAKTPVKQMAINLGAPGDRKDSQGNLWLSYPRRTAYRETSLDVTLDLKPKFSAGRNDATSARINRDGLISQSPRFAAGEAYHNVNEHSTTVQDTDRPWLYTSWAEGIEQLTLPLLGPNDEPATYRLRLHFARVDAHAETVVFDVFLQGMPALKDVRLESPGEGVATAIVHEIEGVQVKDNLLLELKTKQGTAILNAIEVIRSE